MTYEFLCNSCLTEADRLSQSISTIKLNFPAPSPISLTALEGWLREVLWESNLPQPKSGPWPTVPAFSIHRTKGRIPTIESGTKMVQGVREVFEITDIGNQKLSDRNNIGKLVLIGRGLNLDYFQTSLAEALSP